MRILLADDERELATSLSKYLRKAGHEVCTITTGGMEVFPAFDSFHPDVVLLDVMMPRFNGIAIAQALVARNPKIKLVLMSGALKPDHPFITSAGIKHFLQKPFPFSSALKLLESLVPVAKAAA